jgi:glycerol-3-phosphate acyltransferase PlsY
MLRTLFSATILAGALAGSAMAQAPDAGCPLPSEPKGIPAAIAHVWSSYALFSDGKQVARGINSIQAIKEAGGWRVTGIMVQAESATAPLPKQYLR